MKKLIVILCLIVAGGLMAQDPSALSRMTGQGGSVVVKDTLRHVPATGKTFFAIQFLKATIVDSIVNNTTVQMHLDTVPVGTIVFGKFTKFKAKKYSANNPPLVVLYY
jgi:hypothetical protein